MAAALEPVTTSRPRPPTGFIESPLKPVTLCLMLATVEQALHAP
ncbi:MAG TPA: hypothetical protein PK306_02170 [Aquabacterium sp.]|nr:hypothetical protein [Aquabacterium sp.]HQC94496.1 hypothetical protein [Aquabacterium sp.]